MAKKRRFSAAVVRGWVVDSKGGNIADRRSFAIGQALLEAV